MTQLKTWLTVLLAFQTCLATGLYWNTQHQLQNRNERRPLIVFEEAAVDRISLSGNDQELTLEKKDGEWIVPVFYLPADESRLKSLFSTLRELEVGWPVATAESSFERFEVAEDKHQRLVRLFHGDQLLGEVFVGSSPSFKKSHLRRGGDRHVYAGSLNSYDLPVTPESWVDKGLLQMKDVTSIEGPDYRLELADGQWRLEGSDQAVDSSKVSELVGALTRLQIIDVADKPMTPEVSLKVGEFNLDLMRDGEEFLARRSDRAQVFSIGETTYETLAETRRQHLYRGPSEADNNSSESEISPSS